MQPALLCQLLFLVVVANAAPVLVKNMLGSRFAWPLDAGFEFADGRPLLGASKTIRGVILSVLVTPIAAVLIGLTWQVGLVVAGAAMAGDLVSSFVKRRMGFPPSGMAIGLDQVPEALFPLLAAQLFLPITGGNIVLGTALFFAGSLLISRVLFKVGLRDRPY